MVLLTLKSLILRISSTAIFLTAMFLSRINSVAQTDKIVYFSGYKLVGSCVGNTMLAGLLGAWGLGKA